MYQTGHQRHSFLSSACLIAALHEDEQMHVEEYLQRHTGGSCLCHTNEVLVVVVDRPTDLFLTLSIGFRQVSPQVVYALL